MLLTRGPQGAGKTRFAHELGLGAHVISADLLRQVLAAPVLTPRGTMGIPQDHDARVWPMLFELLDERMERGELLVVDATHAKSSHFQEYRKLAKRHRYELLVVDFSTVPLERCLEQNASRPAHQVVPEDVVRRFHEQCLRGRVPESLRRVTWDPDDAHLAEVRAFLEVPIRDLSAYDAVLHIGDLQGCHAPLAALLSGGVRDDVFYVFVGDVCDRGPENGETLRLVMDLAQRDHVAVVWGNHEDHLHRFALGLEAVSGEFGERTQPQLEAAGITPEEVETFCARMVEVLFYEWRGQKVMVCHAGMPAVPEVPVRISSRQWAKGVGSFEDPVDARFDELAPEGWLQVHGHRNNAELPVRAGERSFNLEDKIEFGGHLRAVRLDAEGWTPIRIPSRRYRTLQETIRLGKLHRYTEKAMPPWVSAELSGAPTTDELDALRSHDLIQERTSTSRPWISAFNFSRDAFFEKAWDDLNVRARGLFVDTERALVVARSYDKFFNLGERPETQLEAVLENATYPVTAYRKDNGFLGIVGYDAHADRRGEEALVFASKSSLESDFAGWLRELVLEALARGTGNRRDMLRRYLRDTHSSFVFEVLDPENDPHVVSYESKQLVLLDVVRRSTVFERAPYETLGVVGKRFGFEVKERMATLPNRQALAAFVDTVTAPEWRHRGVAIEGVVLEDAAGFMLKIKGEEYSFWKRMRGLKDRVLKIRGTDKPLQRDLSDPRAKAFHEWLERQADEVLERDIIALREAFLDGRELPRAPIPAAPDKKLLGFARALDNLAASASIKADTAEKLLQQALAHAPLMAELAAHALKVPLVLAAPDGDTRRDAADALGVDVD